MHNYASGCSRYLTKHNLFGRDNNNYNKFLYAYNYTLSMVVTIFASQVLPFAVNLCLICLKLENAKVVTRGRTFTSAMSVGH